MDKSFGFWIDRLGSGNTGSGPGHFRKLGLHAIVWVTEGRGECQIFGREKSVFGRNQALLLFPDIACRYEPLEEGWKTRWIVWGGGNLLESQGHLTRNPFLIRTDAEALDLIHRRLTSVRNGSSPRHRMEEHLILCELVQLIHQAQEKEGDFPLLQKIEKEILRSPTAPISIETLARSNGISPAHLRRLFKSRTGLAPKPYMTSLRMSRARQLALEGHPIEKIAEMLGYDDKFFFMRVFRQHHGTTVESFRRANRL